ncbi:MAG: molybdenum cofactor sulfurase [Proteobacteria bacterium SG_bin9]|nr:MAG: molybdenum cofactor sulfurase [Proteobacteria bacterium SG_bin9]
MTQKSSATIDSIYRYPVKGLSPERLARVALSPGQTLPSDRRYAIENGPSGFDPENPKHFPKSVFLMLMRNERLAALRTHFDDATTTLTIRENGAEKSSGNLEAADGRAAIEDFFKVYSAADLKGSPKVLTSGGHSFSDVPRKVVSIINLASVAALEDIAGQPVDPLRFRGNVYVSGWPAWSEFELVGRTLAIGKARLHIVKPIVRCAAINVDPVTAARDLNLPHEMMRHLGHADCGIYAEVITGGDIAAGDAIVEAEPARI